MTELEATVAIWGSGLLALIAFLTTVSERLQKLLGPIGRYFKSRRHRAVEHQKQLENLMEQRHDAQIAMLLEEIELYKARYAQVLSDTKHVHEENLRLIQEIAALKKERDNE